MLDLCTGCPQANGSWPATERHAWAYTAVLPIGGVDRAMGLELLSDESVLRFYEDIRQQVIADLATGNPDSFIGEAAKQQAERLRIEIDRRRLRCSPIEWRD